MTPAYTGSSHDFSIFKEEGLGTLLPYKTPIYLDTGFEGIKKICPDQNIRKPKKKPKSRQLNGGEKYGNHVISKRRVRVEHAIGGMKKFKIASDKYRGIHPANNQINSLAASLWNLHIRLKPGETPGTYSL